MFSRVTRGTGSVAQKAQIWQGCFSPAFSLEPGFGTEWIPERGCKWQLQWKSWWSFWSPMVMFHKGPRCQGGFVACSPGAGSFWCRALTTWIACWEACEQHSQLLRILEFQLKLRLQSQLLRLLEKPLCYSVISISLSSSGIRRTNQLLHQVLARCYCFPHIIEFSEIVLFS